MSPPVQKSGKREWSQNGLTRRFFSVVALILTTTTTTTAETTTTATTMATTRGLNIYLMKRMLSDATGEVFCFQPRSQRSTGPVGRQLTDHSFRRILLRFLLQLRLQTCFSTVLFHREHLPLKVMNVKFNFDVKFLT